MTSGRSAGRSAADHHHKISITDSFPMPVCRLPVCRLMRASHCRLFKAEATFGHNETNDQTIYGFRGHVEIAWPGVVVGAVVNTAVAPANEHDIAVAPEVLEGGPKREDPRDAPPTVTPRPRCWARWPITASAWRLSCLMRFSYRCGSGRNPFPIGRHNVAEVTG